MSGDTLGIELPKETRSPGPVYQGVCAGIRTLQALNADADADAAHGTRGKPGKPGAAWAARFAATIAQARSIAGSIDRESGHEPRTRQASGVSLAALHERLDALMLRLDPEGVASATATPALDTLTASWGQPVYTTPPDERVT
jgi:hypothetical protein